MTTIIGWVGVDSRGPSSLNLAADSRLTWNGVRPWDYAQKLFTANREQSADMFGYCGGCLFPLTALAQITSLIDLGLLFSSYATASQRIEAVYAHLQLALRGFPSEFLQPFSIVYASRSGTGVASQFTVAVISHDTTVWSRHIRVIPDTSDIFYANGSGVSAFSTHAKETKARLQGGTSRSIYWSFVDSLEAGADPASGGAPQLVSMYRRGPGRPISTLWRDSCWLNGVPLIVDHGTAQFECRDKLFQRCDPRTRQPLATAQRHAR